MTKNEMTLIGFLGSDPELKSTASGRAVTNFSVATTERWKDKAGTAQERTEWHRIVAWGSLAEVVAKHLHKGAHVHVAGPLRSREYEKDGITRRVWEVVANEVLFLDRAEKSKPEDRPPAGTEEDAPF
jgi:single-strand DNA-binding protein